MSPALTDQHIHTRCRPERALCAKVLHRRVAPQFLFVGAQHAAPQGRTIIASWVRVVAPVLPALRNEATRAPSTIIPSCLPSFYRKNPSFRAQRGISPRLVSISPVTGAPPLVSKGGSSLFLSSRSSRPALLRVLGVRS